MKIRHLLLAATLGTLSSFAMAQNTPIGLWKTIDDDTKAEKSLVRIADSGGTLSGRIEKLFNPSKPNPVCEKCSDDRKDKPITGMTIVSGLRQADDGSKWEGGEILDPNNGKTYKVRMTPVDGGSKLEVRGFVGVSLIGRTQTWIRVE